ncbi:unnamed protein product [Diamesa hyperborea]
MDITTFSEDSFDEINWINETFKDVKTNKDNAISGAIGKLQLYVQQLDATIEQTTQQIIQNQTEVVGQSKTLHTQCLNFREKMNDLEKDIFLNNTESETALCNLERLDNLKTKLMVFKNGLIENDSWGKLSSELEELFEKKDILLCCDKLFALQNSLSAQQGLAGQSERDIQLEDFKNRLEAVIAPLIVQSFGDGNIDDSKKYVEIFIKLDRLPQIQQYYRTLQKNALNSHWNEITDVAENSGNQRFLRDFYEYLLSNWSKQVKWCRQVFSNDGQLEPTLVMIETLTNLQPTRESIINSSLKRSNEKMELLLEISQANVSFGQSIQEKFSELEVNNLSDDIMRQLSKSVFDFFNIFIIQYTNMEQTTLNTQLDILDIMRPSAGETIRCLEGSISKIFDWTNESITRSANITQHCAVISLVYMLNTFYKNYLEKFKKGQLQLEASRTANQDWNLLQICINLLQSLGEFWQKVGDVEESIKAIIFTKKEEEKENFRYKMIGKRELNDFQKMLNRFTENDSKFVIFDNLEPQIAFIAKDIHQTMLLTVFKPIENYFMRFEICESNSSGDSDLPDFSMAPMEFITEIGQYLLTLPQHLEPLLLSPASPLKTALEMSENNYQQNIPSADVLLSLVADETCALFQEKISKITKISDDFGAKQLATDIEYLQSILEELGLSIWSQLKSTAVLMKVKTDNYSAQSTGMDPRLVTFIRQMRNIISE